MDRPKIPQAPKHINSGDCPKCDLIFNRYPDFYAPLRDWFKEFQSEHPEAHISCAGRGEQDQMEAFLKKVSRAEWGASAHNYSAAIDTFAMLPGDTNIYNRAWYEKTLKPELAGWLKWYGAPGSPFPEICHIEVAEWRALLKAGALVLVE